MGRNKRDVFQNQMKTLENISERIQLLIDRHRDIKNGRLGVMFRTVIEPNGVTVYHKGSHGKGDIHKGVRACDYKFSKSNPDFIEPSREHGLSFSLTMKHAIDTMQFLAGFQKKGTKIRCAYWILEGSLAIPEGLEFVQDIDNPSHYFLAVTRKMRLTELVEKLNWISQRVAVMNDLPMEAYKNA